MSYLFHINNFSFENIKKELSSLIGEEVEVDYTIYPTLDYFQTSDPVEVRFVTKKNSGVASFALQELPGCCGVLVSYHTNVSYGYTNKGIATLLQDLKEKIAIHAGYPLLMGTDVTNNIPQMKIFDKAGWESVVKVLGRTKNTIDIRVKAVQLEVEEEMICL